MIEDRFAGPRPAWERVGAVLTEDVRPFERRKLRLPNGAHSLLAYAGTLAGHTFVHEAIADLRAGREIDDPAAERLARGIAADQDARTLLGAGLGRDSAVRDGPV